MKRVVQVLLSVPLLVLLTALIFTTPAESDAEAPPIEGWYTRAQAERGRDAYLKHCAECHAVDLAGRAGYISLFPYPALKGAYFFDRFGGQTVHTLLEIISQTMPLDNPGVLGGDTYADITAYILQENRFPAGNEELPPPRQNLIFRLSGMTIDQSMQVARDAAPQEVEETGLAQTGEAPNEPEEPDEPEEEEAPDAPNDTHWYSEEQAQQGEQSFLRHCAKCHGRALQGTGVAPSLAGENFMARWEGESVYDLYDVMRRLMPLDNQGGLEDETYAAIAAFVLRENGFAAGDAPLPTRRSALEELILHPDTPEDLPPTPREPVIPPEEPEERSRRT